MATIHGSIQEEHVLKHIVEHAEIVYVPDYRIEREVRVRLDLKKIAYEILQHCPAGMVDSIKLRIGDQLIVFEAVRNVHVDEGTMMRHEYVTDVSFKGQRNVKS